MYIQLYSYKTHYVSIIILLHKIAFEYLSGDRRRLAPYGRHGHGRRRQPLIGGWRCRRPLIVRLRVRRLFASLVATATARRLILVARARPADWAYGPGGGRRSGAACASSAGRPRRFGPADHRPGRTLCLCIVVLLYLLPAGVCGPLIDVGQDHRSLVCLPPHHHLVRGLRMVLAVVATGQAALWIPGSASGGSRGNGGS